MSSSIWHLLHGLTMPSNAFCMTTAGMVIAAFSHCCHRKLSSSDWPYWVRQTSNPIFDKTPRESCDLKPPDDLLTRLDTVHQCCRKF